MKSMGRWIPSATAVVAALLAFLSSGCEDPTPETSLELRDAARIEGAPMCPWRNPAADAAALFPGATRSDTEVRILSGVRTELAQRLGRTPAAEENALYVHRVWREDTLVGEVIVRRVKGESGAVELVVGFDPAGRIQGVLVQRSREPEPVATALGRSWLNAFQGKSGLDRLVPGEDLPTVPDVARTTAVAMAEGVRSLLILREIAEGPRVVRRPAPEASTGPLHKP